MKPLLNAVIWAMAINFIAVLGLLGWLYKSGRLDRQKIGSIKEIVFPESAEAAPATQPATAPSARPGPRLDELLARYAGMPVSEQVELMRRSFDSQMMQLDRRQRELADLQRQIELARSQIARDRGSLDEKQKALESRVDEAARLAGDKGFQDSLERYQALPSRQVKSIFMSLDDATVIRYLQAMDARQAGKIMKEFKSPEETERLKKVMEKMRQAQSVAGKE